MKSQEHKELKDFKTPILRSRANSLELQSQDKLVVRIELPDGKNYSEKELIDFVEHGKKEMDEFAKADYHLIKKDSEVLIVGTSGVGKSTLINYLNGSELAGEYIDGKLKIKLISNSLPGGFNIGHSTNISETLYPEVYSPDGANYSFVDSPGFGDSRGAAIDIANLFFRKYVTEGVSNIKILLVCSYSDLTDPTGRGANFFKSYKALGNFCGAFKNQKALEELSKSIGIVITQVTDELANKIKKLEKDILKNKKLIKISDSEDDIQDCLKELQEYNRELESLKEKQTSQSSEILVKSKLEEFIKSKSEGLSKNEVQVLEYIIKNNIFATFKSPNKEGPIDVDQKSNILDIINNKLEFMSHETANIKIVVSKEHSGQLGDYINHVQQKLYEKLSDEIKKGIDKSISKTLKETHNVDEIKKIQKSLEKISKMGTTPTSLIKFLEVIDDDILSPKTKEQCESTNKVIDTFNTLMEESNNKSFSPTQKYIEVLPELGTYLANSLKELFELSKKLEPVFESGTIICKGHFIEMSSIKAKIERDESITVENLKAIKVYSLNSFILDDDLTSEKLQSSNFTIVAPKWVVTKSSVTINISGSSQESYPNGVEKASNGSNNGDCGEHGLKGLFGLAGGNFFGLGEEFDQIENLQIISNGGKGGNGQKGGDGAEGAKGVNAMLDNIQNADRSFDLPVGKGKNTYYLKSGAVGGKGGDAGLGGEGGDGGIGGRIRIFDLAGKDIVIKQEINEGTKGDAGADGQVGIGGYYGDTVVEVFYSFVQNLAQISLINCGHKSSYMMASEKRAENGGIRKKGEIKETVEKTREKLSLDIEEIINEYVSFEENVQESFETLRLPFFGKINCELVGSISPVYGEDIM
ncbi:hypothetical protein [Candidatus Tisiphia endosymbiont of Ptychoptera albimana]|uniref:hypothetical protein n=1 Tax=Candidatus Tisiphia endosymbiont of Ptychoptera albimana TaxID=3066260 RepID=UPI00312C9CD9